MNPVIDLGARRAAEARIGRRIGRAGYRLLVVTGSLALVLAIAAGVVSGHRALLLFLALSILLYVPAIWWKRRLSRLPADGPELNERLSGDVLSRLKKDQQLTPASLWQALADHWQARFFLNHLLLTTEMVSQSLAGDTDLAAALSRAGQLADQHNLAVIEPGFVVAGLLAGSPAIAQLLKQFKAQPADVEAIAHWLGRGLAELSREKPSFGGVARDWAFGFTPLLDRLGQNVSRGIMRHGAHFGWLMQSAGVKAIEAAFDNRAAAVALIGPEGIGKTSSVYALAQRLIEGQTGPTLAYHEIIALNATDITSRARGPGDLEHIMLQLANEAAHAGHVILFLDNSQLFFGDTPGSFDASQILLSIIEARAVRVILAMTPPDYQRLKARSASLANLLTPVVLQELPEAEIMRIIEDAATGLEARHHILISYEALREAYRLSGRYEQDEAYPGKALKLLEQAIAHAEHSAVTAGSVQRAVEQSRGVKVSSAAPAEADQLLNLEDRIHQRMINQAEAVNAVSNALRRARAGVTNPNRPIGSFLFLGPTGVGKTELAKAVAATYFGAETSMIRLDMSEYQRPEDVSRLLATGENESASLLLAIRQQPFAVVLLDEIEKAHPNILNLLLQLLDEGQLTDAGGRPASFKDAVIIATSNAGANEIRERVGRGEDLESFREQLTDQLINSGQFKPELLNRFDEIVLFRPLNPQELAQVVRLMLNEVNATLANQNIRVELTDAAVAKIVEVGNDPRLGARPMRRTLQKAVEDTVAQKILKSEAQPGSQLTLDAPDLSL